MLYKEEIKLQRKRNKTSISLHIHTFIMHSVVTAVSEMQKANLEKGYLIEEGISLAQILILLN